MILSHRHRFIYVRCRKTASTSTELALSRICGPDDVVTRLPWPEDEALRRQIGGRGPQNHLGPDGRMRFYNHMPAAEIRLLAGDEVWDTYYKWCVERNPWDKVLSDYYYRFRHPTRPSLHEFLESGLAAAARNFPLYTVGGDVVVNHVARYERLEEDLRRVAATLGLPAGAMALPRAKAGFRPDGRHYSSVYTPQERALVQQIFADEIAVHGYDLHDVFVLQCSGRKHWMVHERHVTDPVPGGGVDPHVRREDLGAIVVDEVLQPGDTLYIPRGWPHYAFTTGTASVHLTIGVPVFTWLDVLALALERARACPELRSTIPLPEPVADGATFLRGLESASRTLSSLLDEISPEELEKVLRDRAEFELGPPPPRTR